MARTKAVATRKKEFLAYLAEGDTIEAAARKASISVRTLYRHRQSDEAFAVAWHDAVEAGCQMLEQQLVEVALGRKEVRNMAAITACFGVLRKRRPELWREKREEKDRGARGARLDLSKLSDDEAALLRRLVGKARGADE